MYPRTVLRSSPTRRAMLLRCHAAAFEALGGVPERILYDRMRTSSAARIPRLATSSTTAPCSSSPATTATCQGRASHIGPRRRARSSARSATSARTSSSAAASATSTISTTQFRQWLDQVANVHVHATTRRVVAEHFAEERPRAPSNSRPGRSRPFCDSSGASRATAWSRVDGNLCQRRLQVVDLIGDYATPISTTSATAPRAVRTIDCTIFAWPSPASSTPMSCSAARASWRWLKGCRTRSGHSAAPPSEHRSDSLSAAFRNLDLTRRRT